MTEKIKSKTLAVSDIFQPKFHSSEIVFATVIVLLSLFLAAQYNTQTKILDNRELLGQPGFWSWLSVFGMVVFGLPYFGTVLKKFRTIDSPEPIGKEIIYWFLSLEFALWFLAYVMLVPIVGYILATILFSLALTFRTGYTDKRFYFWAVVFSFANVIIFKGFLKVSIPGGQLYELLPAALRNFMITYF
ncbi:tripartite tricarboxylate transporter TctB family protein [Lentibacter algarum]|uniref:tripartite tricarboxylate transporter TctB family protein n=1 Tax=Lentibacter algarum TaxID=576131 RepID=UPI001C0A2E35|nr:tripartite tricarboxylate transporter TctB family protein [Lentibacter algarum]MBU2983702.1 tripartite tricarboxylate transporter TctB family protein [Lentibacter algarum]